MRKIIIIMMLLLEIIALNGCTPQLTLVEVYTHEAGEVLKEDVQLYVTFENPEMASEAEVDLGTVVADKVGTYEATITYKNKEYPFTVEVVDTTAPDGVLNQFVITCGIDEKILPDKFEGELSDLTSVEIGLRNPTLMIEEEELAKLIIGNLQEADEKGSEYVTYMDMIDYEFNEETDTWDESGVLIEELSSEFVPEKTGLYRLEYCAVDEYGNADITFVYVIADLEAPVLNAEDIEVKLTSDINKYMESLNKGILAEDNLMGDLSSYIEVKESMMEDGELSNMKMKISYMVSDVAGNISEASRSIKLKSNTVVQGASNNGNVTNAESTSNGHDRARAEQAFAAVNQQRAAAGLHELIWDEGLYDFACTRSTQIVSDFSHTMPDGTRAVSYLANNVGGASGYGENIAANYKSITNLVNGWMNSAGHRGAILDGRYTHGTMGCYGANGTYYWMQIFKSL